VSETVCKIQAIKSDTFTRLPTELKSSAIVYSQYLTSGHPVYCAFQAVVHFKKLASDAIRDKRSVLQSKLELIEDARDCEMRFIEAVEKMETFAVENERLGEMAR
jgi:hypothetical protein